MTGMRCPGCGTPRGTGGTAGHGCDCAERAAEAVRTERDAQIAAAEDFDPLRIRPYVTLRGIDDGGDEPDTADLAGLRAGPAPPPATGSPRPGPEGAARPPTRHEPAELAGPAGPAEPPQSRRRRLSAGLAVGAAVAATAVFAGGLFSGGDEVDRTLPDPESGTSAVSTVNTGPAAPSSSSATRAASLPVSASASAPVSRTPSPSHSGAAGPGPSGKPSAQPSTPPPSTTRATGTVSEPPPPPSAPATLRRGDSGPQVVELQKRLGQALVYSGPADGQYGQGVEDAVRLYQWDRDVEGDAEGVYGPMTRRALESETDKR